MQSEHEGSRALPYLLILILGVVVIASGLVVYLTRSDSSSTDAEAFVRTANAFAGGKFEASGVTQVTGTNGFLFVDDGRPSEVLWIQLDRDGRQMGSIKEVKLGINIEDPEGITSDGSHVYVVGSQATRKSSEQAGIVRFEFNRDTQSVDQVQTVSELKRFLVENVAELRNMASIKAKDDGINIEGLAWDPIHGHLLLGLRSPVVDGNALLVPLKLRDPRGPFSYDNLETKGLEAIRLPLGGLGIRSIEYDEQRRLFDIIAGATESQDKTDFQLWEWGGQADSSRLREVATFDRKLQPEGIAPASIDGSNFKFVVFDTSKYLKMQ
jgi:uncharacterized protein DUF3616